MRSPEEYENLILNEDCVTFLDSLPEGSLDLTVTSPPYNVGIEYDDHDDTAMTYEKYLEWLEDVFLAMYRAHKEHSYVAINIGRNTEKNTPMHLAMLLEKAGFKFYKSLVWVKPQGAATQTFWYKYPHPRYYEPYLVTEDVLIYSKGDVKGEHRGPKLDILEKSLIDAVASNVWRINPDSHKVQKGVHPAPFPIELPSRLIQLLSVPGDIVYDPFVGSGTTCLAAYNLGRKYVGTDISKEYCEYAKQSLGAGNIWEMV